jgi:hypothetical protein
MAPTDKTPTARSRSDVAAFLQRVAATPTVAAGDRGRLIFALDATASRGPTWAQASAIQADMFRTAAAVRRLDVQLVYYRGLFDFGASPWLSDEQAMVTLMRQVSVLEGQTQILRVLKHAAAAAQQRKVNALVFVGDAMEESADGLIAAAGELALRGVPAFMFHEGGGEPAGAAFRRIAELTRGAYCSFDGGSARELRDLLTAVAVYAAGGQKALQDYGARTGGAALRLTRSLDRRD